MTAPAWFVDEISAIGQRLRSSEPSNPLLNYTASQVDHLGRLLYGFGCARVREVAECFTAALGDLIDARGGAQLVRAEAVERAVAHLEAAARHAAATEPAA